MLLLSTEVNAQAVRVGHRYKVCEGGVCRAYMDSGSGTMIHDDGIDQWILTAGHTFRGEPNKALYESLGVYCGVSQWRRCELVAMTITDDVDLALLRTHGHQFAGEPETLHDPVSVPAGETVGIGGFGGGLDGKWVTQRGVLASPTQVNVASRHGDSGGPVHHSGKLYGISRSSDTRRFTYFTPISLCWPFLRMHCPPCAANYIPRPPPELPPEPHVINRKDSQIEELQKQVVELQTKLESLTLEQVRDRADMKKQASFFSESLKSIRDEKLKVQWIDANGSHTETYMFPYRVRFNFNPRKKEKE